MSETLTAPAPADTAAPEPTAPVTPAPTPASWRDSLPPELKDAPALGKYQDVPSLAKGYVEAQALIGRKGVVVPTDKDPPEVHAAYRAALGVPEKADGYTIKPPEGLPPEAWSEESSKTFSGWAHELGLTPAQAQGLAERYAKLTGGALQQQDSQKAEAKAATEAVLRQEWGAAFGAKLAAADTALRTIGGEELAKYMQDSGLGNHPAMVRAWAKIGESIGEDRPNGMGSGRTAVMTPTEAKSERLRIMGDAQGPYWNNRHPEHKLAVQRVADLIRMETPD